MMRAEELRDLVADQVGDVHDLIDLLEIEMEDVLVRFTDRLYEHKEKFGIDDVSASESC